MTKGLPSRVESISKLFLEINVNLDHKMFLLMKFPHFVLPKVRSVMVHVCGTKTLEGFLSEQNEG